MALLIARAEEDLARIYNARDNAGVGCGHRHYDELCRASRGGGTPSRELLQRHAAEEAIEREKDIALYQEEKDAERWLAILL